MSLRHNLKILWWFFVVFIDIYLVLLYFLRFASEKITSNCTLFGPNCLFFHAYIHPCFFSGVILYILLSGTPPFTDERQTDKKLREQILTANFIFYPQLFNSVSKEAKVRYKTERMLYLNSYFQLILIVCFFQTS